MDTNFYFNLTFNSTDKRVNYILSFVLFAFIPGSILYYLSKKLSKNVQKIIENLIELSLLILSFGVPMIVFFIYHNSINLTELTTFTNKQYILNYIYETKTTIVFGIRLLYNVLKDVFK